MRRRQEEGGDRSLRRKPREVDKMPFRTGAVIKVSTGRTMLIGRTMSMRMRERGHCDVDNGCDWRCGWRCDMGSSFRFCGNVHGSLMDKSMAQLWRRGRRSGTGFALTLCVNADTVDHNCGAVGVTDNGQSAEEGAMCCRRRATYKLQQCNTRRPQGLGGRMMREKMDGGGPGREMDADQLAQGTKHGHGDGTAVVEAGTYTPREEAHLGRNLHVTCGVGPLLALAKNLVHDVGRATDGNGNHSTMPHHSPRRTKRVQMHLGLAPCSCRSCHVECAEEEVAESRRSAADGRRRRGEVGKYCDVECGDTGGAAGNVDRFSEPADAHENDAPPW